MNCGYVVWAAVIQWRTPFSHFFFNNDNKQGQMTNNNISKGAARGRELRAAGYSSHAHTNGDDRGQCNVARGGRAEQRDMGRLSSDVGQAPGGHPNRESGNN